MIKSGLLWVCTKSMHLHIPISLVSLQFFFQPVFLALKEGMMENKVISKVAIVVPKQFYDQANQFWRKCREIAPSLNVGLSDPIWFPIPDSNVSTYTSAIERQVHGKAPHLVS